MKLDEITAMARDWGAYASRFGIAEEVHQGAITEEQLAAFARSVLALLTPEKPCGWSSDDVCSDAGDGYVRVYALRDLRADEARWAAMETLKAAEQAEGKER